MDTRHSQQTIASFVDGHVELADFAGTDFSKNPAWGGAGWTLVGPNDINHSNDPLNTFKVIRGTLYPNFQIHWGPTDEYNYAGLGLTRTLAVNQTLTITLAGFNQSQFTADPHYAYEDLAIMPWVGSSTTITPWADGLYLQRFTNPTWFAANGFAVRAFSLGILYDNILSTTKEVSTISITRTGPTSYTYTYDGVPSPSGAQNLGYEADILGFDFILINEAGADVMCYDIAGQNLDGPRITSVTFSK